MAKKNKFRDAKWGDWEGWDDVKLEDLQPRKMGDIKPRQTLNGSFADAMISRAGTQVSDHYEKILASNFPWDETLSEDEVTSAIDQLRALTAGELTNMGFVLYGRSPDLEQVEAQQVLLRKKTGKPSHIIQAGTSSKPTYELWYQKNAVASMGKVADWNGVDNRMAKVATKKIKYIIPENVEKVAWSQVEKYNLLDGMEHVGFNVYQSSEPGGVWWKEKIEDPDTGDIKYFLVKKKGTEKAKDVGGNKVVAIDKAASVGAKMVKIAEKVLIRKAVEKNEGIDKEVATETPASKSEGIEAKIVDLNGKNWKSEIDDYLKKCKNNGLVPKKMEVRVIDWQAEGQDE